MLSNRKTQLERYMKSRHVRNRPICQAPFNSMYFNVYGEAGPCWLNLVGMGKYPDDSIREIWFGEKFSSLRKAIEKQNLSYKCHTCNQAIMDGNHHSVLSKLYDHEYELTDYPSVMEFELSNRCNLECVMCKGDLSSTIRQNREKRPPLVNPYDEAFVDQLDEFIPHLKEAKFLGGEPFLIEEYYGIWEKMIELNPDIKLTVTTNGTVFNNRVKKLISRLKFNVIVSIDSFHKETYEDIRIRGNFDRVMQNFHSFLEYTQQAKTYFQVSMNPLRRNMWQLHEYVDFCNQHAANLWFNTVLYPHHESIKTLPFIKLAEIYNFLKNKKLKPRNKECSKQTYENNINVFNNFVENQLRIWMLKEKDDYEKRKSDADKLSSEELIKTLERELQNYVKYDAYLTDSEKHKQIKIIEEKLNALESAETSNVVSLANRAPSEIMDFWGVGVKL